MPGLQIDADLAADGAVHLRQQRRRHLHERDAAQIGRRDKSRQVADHTAAERDDERFSFQPMHRELVITTLDHFKLFAVSPGGTTINAGKKPARASELKAGLANRLPTLVSVMMAQRGPSFRRAHLAPRVVSKPPPMVIS